MDTTLVDRKVLASSLGVSIPTVDRLKKKGVIPYYKIGDRVKFDLDEVKNALWQVDGGVVCGHET